MNHAAHAAAVAALAGQGERLETPLSCGPMVWHRWGPVDRQAPKLVLFHGGWGSWTHWFRVIPALAERFTVLAADTPGFGDSATPPEPHTGESIATLMTEGLRQLLAPDELFQLAGFSNGGLLGSLVARNFGTQCRGFVAVGASGFGDLHTPPRGTALAESGMTDDEIDALQRRNLEILMFKNPANIDGLTIHIHRRNLERGRVRSRRISLTNALVEALPDIKAPIGGIWGEFDATVDGWPGLDKRKEIFQAVQPGAPFQVLLGCGHWAMHEMPDEFLAALLPMLETLDRKGA